MILVTGGTGFVGRNLVRELIKDYKVRCLVRNPDHAGELRDAGCELVRGDITEKQSLPDAFGGGVEAVFHLVGILAESKGVTFQSIHVEGTRNVIGACKRMGVKRYLHISALGTRPGARSAYYRTKWEAEEIVRGSGLEYTIFRPSVIFGKEDKFTNLFARIIRLSPVIMVPGDGKNRMQPVFVKDLVRAMSLSLKKGETKKKVYEVAGTRIYTFDEIIDRIADLLGKKRFKAHIPMPFMRMSAKLMESILSRPPLTGDQLLMLEEDSITSENALTGVFGIQPTGFVEGMKTYLH